MTRFLKLVRQNGSWQALPTETYDLALDSQLKKDDAPIDPVQLLRALAPLLSVDGGINGIDKTPQLASSWRVPHLWMRSKPWSFGVV